MERSVPANILRSRFGWKRSTAGKGATDKAKDCLMGAIGELTFHADLDYTERISVWETFNSRIGLRGGFCWWLTFAVFRCGCCHQTGTEAERQRLLPGARLGLAAGICLGARELCQGAGQARGAARSPHSPTSLWWQGRAAAWPGSQILVWGLGLGQAVGAQQGPTAPFGMGNWHGERSQCHMEASRAGRGW